MAAVSLQGALCWLNKANGATFLWRAIAYEPEGQVYRQQMRQDFAVVIFVVCAV